MIDATAYTYTWDEEDEGDDTGPPPFAPGVEIAPGYLVVSHLRRGKNLDVYDVWSDERRCSCVAKVLRPDRLDDRQARTQLLREGRALQRMTHPHIVRGYETMTEPQPMFIMETLGGQTLGYLIEHSEEDLPIVEVAYLGLHLCSAIHYLHRQNIIHLDLKPSNIIATTGIARVLDLSVARKPGRLKRATGSYGFMSPEQNEDGGTITFKTDVWGIGAVLFAATTGEAPFDHDEPTTSAPQPIVPFAPLRSLRDVPEEFAEIIESCLQIDPDRRPTVDELADALNKIIAAHEAA